MYCPKCEINQNIKDFDCNHDGGSIVCKLCKSEFDQAESLDFEWNLMIKNNMKRFPKIFFKEYFDLLSVEFDNPLYGLAAYVDKFYHKWDLFTYFEKKPEHFDRIGYRFLHEIRSSVVIKEVFRNHFGTMLNGVNAHHVVNRDIKIDDILN